MDTRCRTRSEFRTGRAEVEAFPARTWGREHEHRLVEELWGCGEDRIAVRFADECHDDDRQWWRAHGDENWLSDADGPVRERYAGIDDVAVGEGERSFPGGRSGPRPPDHPGLGGSGL